jgi:hypothetical protein
MKKNILFILILLIFSTAFSQSKEYSLALNSGVSIPGNDLSYAYNTGFNLGLDFQNYKKPWSFFAEFNGNFFKGKKEYYTDESKFKEILELTAGPRYFIDLKSVHPFLDLGLGIYFANVLDMSVRAGLSAGIGTVIKLNEKSDILIKAKYHPYYVSGQNGYNEYFGIYAGIKYNFNF